MGFGKGGRDEGVGLGGEKRLASRVGSIVGGGGRSKMIDSDRITFCSGTIRDR